MNVASLENSRKLHELSGWDGHTNEWWYHNAEANSTFTDKNPSDYQITEPIAPAYDLGYLLRKLPNTQVKLKNNRIERPEGNTTFWRCQYRTDGKMHMDTNRPKPYMGHNYEYSEIADTPEDAACKLAVELIKQGVLNPKEDNHGE